MNIQFAIKDSEIYFIEVNPRASRTVPFVSKATGVQWAKMSALVMVGHTLKELGILKYREPGYISVKEVVIPFNKFPDVDAVLGPEMKSTGEVMGLSQDFGTAFLKAQQAAGQKLPKSGSILVTVTDLYKPGVIEPVKILKKLGYSIISTGGTAKYLMENGIECRTVYKLSEGRPNIIDEIKNGNIQIIFNTPAGKDAHADDTYIRKTAITLQIPLFTTIQAMLALAEALESLHHKGPDVCPLSGLLPVLTGKL